MTEFTTWRSLVDGAKISAIPDSGMFQSPIIQWWAGEGIESDDGQPTEGWVDTIAELEATDVESPVYRQDQEGFEAVDYSEGDNGHDFNPSSFPTGDDPVSWAALLYVPENPSDQIVLYWGNDGAEENFEIRFQDDETIRFNLSGAGTDAIIGFDTGQWITVGGSYEGGSDGQLKAFHNTAVEVGETATGKIGTNHYNIGYRGANNDFYSDVFVAEVIFSDVEESEQAYEDYHNDRLG